MNEIWTSKECADYCRRDVKYFLSNVRNRPDFPRPLEISENGRPLWYSEEVRKWALKQRIAA